MTQKDMSSQADGVEGDTWLPMNQMVRSCSGVQKMCRREHPSHAEKGWWFQENLEGADNGINNREGFCYKTCEGVKKHMAQLYSVHPTSTRGSHVGI